MKVATWNVNGLRARHAELVRWAAEEQPDVLCLQEIKCLPGEVPEALTTLPEYWSYWHGGGGYSGVSLHLRRAAFREKPVFSHPDFDRETRIVEARVGDVTFASVYVPNGGKDYPAKLEFLKRMAEYARGKRLVLSGDLNVTRTDRDVHPKERKPKAIGQRPDERALFEEVLAAGLVDVCRVLHPDDDGLFTWWPYWREARANNVGWRLDYVLTSGIAATSAEVRTRVGTSDHAPVVVELQQEQP